MRLREIIKKIYQNAKRLLGKCIFRRIRLVFKFRPKKKKTKALETRFIKTYQKLYREREKKMLSNLLRKKNLSDSLESSKRFPLLEPKVLIQLKPEDMVFLKNYLLLS